MNAAEKLELVPDIEAARALFVDLDQIHLVAINPAARDAKPLGRDFGTGIEAAVRWALQLNADGWNVYWTVNAVRPGLDKKPLKADMIAARFVHVDVDPPKDGSAWSKEGALVALSTHRPEPSFVIDSGNGLQAFWRLSEPVENKSHAEDVNNQLRHHFGGDACHNIDRLMRVPGFVNYPDAKKTAAGRVPQLAKWVVDDDGVVYELEQVRTSLPPVPAAPEKIEGVTANDGGGEWRLITPDDLSLGPLDSLRSAIEHPPGRDRSGDGVAVARLMATAKFAEEQILGILLNPANAVSSHYLSQRDPRRAALRTLELIRPDEDNTEDTRSHATTKDMAEAKISATPFQWRDPATIPQRPWIYGRHLLRGTVSLLIAPGATGKSALVAGRALSLVTGMPFLRHTVWNGPKRVWIWNLEDPREELDRSIMGAALHWDLQPGDIADRLFVDTALDGAGLCLASANEKGTIIRPVAEALAAELDRRAIDVLIVDPFISSHACDENDNPSIDAVVKEWGRIANRTATSILLVHHTRKQITGAIDADSARGAKALVDGARMVEALNRMTPDEAEKFGLSIAEHRQYFSSDAGAKPNRAPAPGRPDWFHLASISLGNGLGGGDSIGVAEPWSPPDAFDGVSTNHLRRVQAIIADGEYRENQQANNWAGLAVADVLDLDLGKKADRRRAATLLREWKDNGCFVVERRPDAKGDVRPFLIVGKPA